MKVVSTVKATHMDAVTAESVTTESNQAYAFLLDVQP
jgi:hypothetical protein